MIAEAIDTAITLGLALAGWVITLAVIASILTLAAIATGAWVVRGAWDVLYARLSASRAPKAPECHPRPKRRHTPSWTHRQSRDYEEAA